MLGKTKDITVIGLGNSDLDDYATTVAAEQGRVVRPDPEPEKGGFFRSDHFQFAQEGRARAGQRRRHRLRGQARRAGARRRATTTRRTTITSRRIRCSPDWDLSGAEQDLQYYWMLGYRLAQAETFPQWKPGVEFKR